MGFSCAFGNGVELAYLSQAMQVYDQPNNHIGHTMAYSRREFLQLLAAAATAGLWSHPASSAQNRSANPAGASLMAGAGNLCDIPTLLPGAPITLEDVMAQTAITYAQVTRNERSGEQLKNILEDIADNRFSRDPYKQQGGDMVRVGALHYRLDPAAAMGSRISALTLHGKPVQPNKNYIVAGWGGVQESENNTPVWDVVADYLRDKKSIAVSDVNQPELPDLTGNKGYQSPAA